MKIKIITGFRGEGHTVDLAEAHKAYYLFLNPDARGVFNNGLALVGKMILGIEPDYHATMGWNPTYKLQDEDWNILIDGGTVEKMKGALQEAKLLVPKLKNHQELVALPLTEALLVAEKIHE